VALDPLRMLPRADYGAVLADPPWRFRTWSAKGRDRCPDTRHYQTMSLEEIAALRVDRYCAKDAALFLWSVPFMLPQALRIGEAWGFTYKTRGFCWVKRGRRGGFPIGLGYWTRGNPEDCLMFTRGKPKRLARDIPELVISERRRHSQKPNQVRGMIQLLVTGPYLELFARDRAPGWDAWGDQLDA
jgi:N6-adenosine-specific RNA methylase IME4